MEDGRRYVHGQQHVVAQEEDNVRAPVEIATRKAGRSIVSHVD